MNKQAVEIARSWIGTPFVAGARKKGQGVDCLQLLIAVYEEITGKGIVAPTYNIAWTGQAGTSDRYMRLVGEKIPLVGRSWKQAEIGDAVLFAIKRGRPTQHAGIKSGPDSMIHSMDGYRVCEAQVSGLYAGKVRGVFRFPIADSSRKVG